jgi:hypothetical protein
MRYGEKKRHRCRKQELFLYVNVRVFTEEPKIKILRNPLSFRKLLCLLLDENQMPYCFNTTPV